MGISEKKMQIVIDNYFKQECDINTSIRGAFEKGFRIGVKKGQSAQPEPHWIPCSERLPENDNEVLITVWDAEDDYVEVYKGFYQGHEWWTQWCHGCSKIKDEPCGENIVIAWMPLPASYKGE